MPNTGFLGWAHVTGSTVTNLVGSDKNVLFYSGSTVLTGSDNFFYDYTNSRLTVTGNLDVSGTVSALKYETVTYENTTYQGTTKFGNSSDDVHQFTGSIALDGDIELAPSTISTAHITSAGSLTMRADANITIGDSTVDSVKIGRTNTTAAKIHLRSGANTDVVVSNSMVGIGTDSPGTQLQVEGSAPYITLKNDTSENSDGGCESKIIFEDHANVTLAQVQGSHDGSSDDTKGDLILSTHNGSSLVEALRIDSAQLVSVADNLHLTSDASVLTFGAGSDVTFTHDNGTGMDITSAGNLDIDCTAGSVTLGASLADGQTLKLGKNGAVETIIAPHGTPGSELYSVINTAGTTDGADAAGSILLSSVAGGIGLAWADDKDLWAEGGQAVITANHNASEAIKLHADAGSSQTIQIINDEGTTDGSEGAGAIDIEATVGGISLHAADDKDIAIEAGQVVLTANHDTSESIKLHADAGSSQTIQIINDAGTTDGSEGAGAIDIEATVGGISLHGADDKDIAIEAGQVVLTANHNTADSIKLHADAGSSQTITLVNDEGTSASAIALTATAGGIAMSAGGLIKTTGAGVEIENGSAAGAAALLIDNDDTNQIALDIDAANIDANVIDIAATALTTGKAIFINHDDSATSAVTPTTFHLDFDKSGVTANSTTATFTGIDVDMNDAATNHAGSNVTMTGMDVAIASANAQGTLKNVGIVVDVQGADENIGIELKNTVNDTNGAILRFTKDKGAAGADGDDIGIIEFVGDDAAQAQTTFAKIVAEVSEAANTDEAGKLSFFVAESDGTNTALTAGLVLEGEHATDGEVDVTIGAGVASTTTVAGDLTVNGGDVTIAGATPKLTVGDNGAEDCSIVLDNSAQDYYLGIDHSDSSKFVLGGGSTVGSFVALTITSAGAASFGSSVTTGGRVIVDDATEATSTTDGSLQTDGGLSVAKSAVIGDDLDLLSDGAIVNFGASKEIVLTHVADTGLTLSSVAASTPVFEIKNTTSDANGAILKFVKDKGAAGAANDVNGLIQFFGDDANQDQVKFSEIKSQVKVHTSNGQEGGKFTISVAEHDGTSTAGLVIEDGDADGELDVTVGAGAASLTTIVGTSLFSGNATFGVDDTGVDVRFFSATTNEGVLYDASQDELALLLTTKLKFHDVGGDEEIFASADGHLEINAGTTLDMTAPTVDVNASTAVTVDTPGVTITDSTASSATEGGFIRLVSNDGAAMAEEHRLGVVEFAGAEDGSGTITVGARIEAICDDNWSGTENGASLAFYTTDADATQTEHMILNSDGNITIGGAATTEPGFGSTKGVAIVNRTASAAAEGGCLRLVCDDNAAMASGHRLGVLEFAGAEASGGESVTVGARIEALCDAGWSSSENGASLVFYTTDADATQSQVLKLDSNKNMFLLADGAAMKFGADSEVTLTHVHNTGLLLSDASGIGTTKLMFGDSATFIQQQADGQLGIDADTEIEIVAPLVDVDASTGVTIDTPSVTITDSTTSSGTEGGFIKLISNDGAAMAEEHRLGAIEFAGAEDASNTITVGARIEAICDETWDATNNGTSLSFYTTSGNASQSEKMILTASGSLGIGTGDPSVGTNNNVGVNIENTGTSHANLGGALRLSHRPASATMQNNTRLGVIEFAGAEDDQGEDAAMTVGARIEALCDATWSGTENGTRLVFYTTDADASQSEVLKIDSNKLATFAGRVITDDATEATSTTDGSLQTDGGLSVAKSAVIGDDLDLLSDGAIVSFGASKEIVLTHVADTGLILSSAAASTPVFEIKNTHNGGSAGILKFNNTEGATDGADGDDLGSITFWGNDDGTPSAQQYAGILAEISDASHGAEGGKLSLQVASHDGEIVSAVTIEDGSAEDEVNVTFASNLIVNSETADAPGAGWNAAGAVTSHVSRINKEVITKIYVDLGAASAIVPATDGFAVGDNTGEASYLTKLTNAVNGVVTMVEFACVETPTSAGTAVTDLNLHLNSASKNANAQVNTGTNSALVDGGDSEEGWDTGATIGQIIEGTPPTGTNAIGRPSGTEWYLYLTAGDSSGNGSDTYNAGKLVITLYGHDF